MMDKIRIEIRDDIKPEIALSCVAQVVANGKISKGENGKMYYCWATTFKTPAGELIVSTRQYTKTDCFVVQKYGK